MKTVIYSAMTAVVLPVDDSSRMQRLRVLVLVIAAAFALPSVANWNPLTPSYTQPWNAVHAIEAISDDGEWIVFSAEFHTEGNVNLYSVRATGGEPIFLDNNGGGIRTVGQVGIVGDRVVYRTTSSNPSVGKIRSVPIDGSETAIVMGPSNSLNADHWIAWGGRVITRLNLIGDSAEVWSTPIDGSEASVRISEEETRASTISQMAVADDRVIYLRSIASPDVTELWSAPIDGSSEAVRLHSALPAGRHVLGFDDASFFQLPGGTVRRILFPADLDVDDEFELYSVSPSGGTPVSLTSSFPATADVLEVTGFGIDRAYFVADGHTDEAFDLYSLTVSSGAINQLTAFDAGAEVVDPVFSTSHAAFSDTAGSIGRLHTVPLDGSAPPRAHGPAAATGAEDWQFAPGGQRVVFRARFGSSGGRALYSGRLLDGAYSILGSSSTSAEDCLRICSDFFIANNDRVIFREVQSDGSIHLLSDTVTGNDPIILSTGHTLRFDAAADGWVVFVADGEVPDHFDLYRTHADGSATSHRITALGGGSQSDVEDIRLFPDGSRVAFVWDEDLDEQFHLFVGDDNRHEVAFTSVTRDVEEAVGTVDLEVEMTQASIDDVIVTVFDTGAGSAQSTDYVFPSDPEVTIPAGQTTGVVVLGIVDDNEEETDETLVLGLETDPSGHVGDIQETTIRILDDDEAGADQIFADRFESGSASAR